MNHQNEMHLANKIRKLLSAKGITLSEAAFKIGISKSTLHDYCHGVYPRNLKTIGKIADYFGVSVQDLLSEKNIGSLSINVTGDVEGEYLVVVTKKKTT